VYKHDFILSGSRETINGNQDYIIYYYIMEKLQEISKDESKVFLEIFENSLEENIENILQKMRGALDFNKKNVMVFYTGVKNSKIKHLDLHVGNIMKDRKGNFKLIDLDLIEIGD
jgi:thiamine kinase-like enzyme